ncbi:MAG: TonB-dependent receptor, partial [Candidatus Eremiobacteraeota bacterium]|nr:TonB-dependent receptor [Candidatus Eremiobacteraeota bacterium]
PSPGAPTPPPYDQFLYDQHNVLSVNDSVGDDKQRLVYGVDALRGIARIDGGTGSLPAPTAYAYSQIAAYVQQQWFAANGNELYAGLRGERDSVVDAAGGAALSPSLGGIVHFSAPVELKLNAATAFRAPTVDDLFYPGFSNPNLQPERTRVSDATIEDSALFGGVSLGWFSTAGSNFIVANAKFVPENIGHASIQGLTLSAQTPGLRGIIASLAVTNLYRAQDLDTQTRIANRGPVFTTVLGLRYLPSPSSAFDGFGITATSEGPRGIVDDTKPIFDQPIAFTRVDAYLGWRITPQLAAIVRGYNLGNERYSEWGTYTPSSVPFYTYPLPGRSFLIELRSR